MKRQREEHLAPAPQDQYAEIKNYSPGGFVPNIQPFSASRVDRRRLPNNGQMDEPMLSYIGHLFCQKNTKAMRAVKSLQYSEDSLLAMLPPIESQKLANLEDLDVIDFSGNSLLEAALNLRLYRFAKKLLLLGASPVFPHIESIYILLFNTTTDMKYKSFILSYFISITRVFTSNLVPELFFRHLLISTVINSHHIFFKHLVVFGIVYPDLFYGTEHLLFLIAGSEVVDQNMIESFVAVDFDLNTRSKGGETLIHSLCKDSRHSCVKNYQSIKFLIGAGAEVNTVDHSHRTPIQDVLCTGVLMVFKLLLESGADPDARETNTGCSIMHLIANSNRNIWADALIDAGANLDIEDVDGFTPLHYALRKDAFEVAAILIRNGASLFVSSKKARAAFYIILEKDIGSLFQLCIDKRDHVASFYVPHHASTLHQCLFYTAVMRQKVDILEILLQYPVDIDQVSLLTGFSALEENLKQNNIGITRLLLRNGANPNTVLDRYKEMREDQIEVSVVEKLEMIPISPRITQFLEDHRSESPTTVSESPTTVSESPTTVSEYPWVDNESPTAVSEYPWVDHEINDALIHGHVEFPFEISL